MDKDPGDYSRTRCSPLQAGEQGGVQVLRTNKIGKGTGQGTVTSGLDFKDWVGFCHTEKGILGRETEGR